ncbi:Txe/YoeB family addiction module toxin [bacterium]|nr:Txe/YoeB family addiction module toxin [bacterium]
MSWTLVYTKDALRDARKIGTSPLRPRVEALLEVLSKNPFQNPPPYKTLLGDLKGAYSRRINIQHRLVYCIHAKEKVVKVLRMWGHY